MVRGWLGAGILAVFLIFSLVAGALIGSAHEATSALLEQAAEKTLDGDFETGQVLAMSAKARWDRQWNGTATMADHNPMDDVDALFGEMEIYAKAQEAHHFAACCAELAQRIQAVSGAHKFSWWNIL